MACAFPCNQGIVVGGGLAGVSAGNTLLECGASVVLLDKSAFCGGNSTKATSGINGAETRTQKEKGIKDTVEIFTNDTLKGGAKRPEVAKVLCANSGPDVDWLMDQFDLDLSLIARLGGHSMPRTHRGKERFPGMTITYALIQSLENIADRSDKARIITKARVFELLTDNGGVVGCKYEKGGETFQEHGAVILASGGFGADFSGDSLLSKYRPDLLHLPTTNGEHCTGDGIKMAEAIGAKSIDLEWVQVHPTGLVKPDDPDAKIKFLAAEALRGVGGLVFDANGNRFANELGRRDYVTGEMWKNKPPFWLCLNKAASDEIIWHCKHYTGRGVMKYYESGSELAKDMGVAIKHLEDVHQQHYEASQKAAKDPEGGKWPAYPSGKSWDDASGPTGSGKKYYHNVIPGSQVAREPFYVAIITPVIHYCMGGAEVNAKGQVMGKGGPIFGLYAAGEVAGGVHGNNRLGGNSLLDCVVFGRVTAREAAKFMLGDEAQVDPKRLQDLRALPPKKAPAVPAGEKAPAAPAAEAAATTKVVKPGWEATYNAERWENKSHPRKHFVRGYKNYMNWSAGPSFHDKVRSKLGLDVEAPLDEPLMEYYERPSTLLNMHYFPLPDERGQNAIIPTFNQNKYTYQIIFEWGSWILESCSSSCVRKTQWVCLILFLLAVSFFFIDLLPGENTRFGIQDFSGTHVEGGKTLVLAPPE